MKNLRLTAALVLGLTALAARADVPHLINYQGRLLIGTNLVNGNVSMALRLFNVSSGGTAQYEDTGTVSVVDGLYSTVIGDQTNSGSFISAFTNETLWVEVAVNGTTLTPRERIASVAHSITTRGLSVDKDRNVILNPDLNYIPTPFANATIGGGEANVISNVSAGTIGGGLNNKINGLADMATVGGGYLNLVSDSSFAATIGGGANNTIVNNAEHATISGGSNNYIEAYARAATIAGGAWNTISGSPGNGAAIGGGVSNFVGGPLSTIAGGQRNSVAFSIQNAAIGGGYLNQSGGSYTFIGGGRQNTADGGYAAIGGGHLNKAIGSYSAIAGGYSNTANSASATIAGGENNTVDSSAEDSTIGGGSGNKIAPNGALFTAALSSTIGGGLSNRIFNNFGFIGGGAYNTVSNSGAAVAGGVSNIARGANSYIGGGLANSISAQSTNAVIGGGWLNLIRTNAQNATIGGGLLNVIWENVQNGTIAGGNDNWVRGDYGTVAGGYANVATNFAFAVGRQAKANHSGAFVWSDSTTLAAVNSSASNEVTFRASGGFRIYTKPDLTIGAILTSNQSSWAALSDRNAKQDFAPVDHDETLRKLLALSVTEWTYKADPAHRRYIGPVAQDFHAAFNLGNDTTINTLDTDGVLLSAMQGLNAKLERENAALKTSLDQTRAELEALKARLDALAPPASGQ